MVFFLGGRTLDSGFWTRPHSPPRSCVPDPGLRTPDSGPRTPDPGLRTPDSGPLPLPALHPSISSRLPCLCTSPLLRPNSTVPSPRPSELPCGCCCSPLPLCPPPLSPVNSLPQPPCPSFRLVPSALTFLTRAPSHTLATGTKSPRPPGDREVRIVWCKRHTSPGACWRGAPSEPERCMLMPRSTSCTTLAVRHASPRPSRYAPCAQLSHDRRRAGAARFDDYGASWPRGRSCSTLIRLQHGTLSRCRPRDPKSRFRIPTIQSQGMTHVVGSPVRLIKS